jgi:putative spermidine/putrescine transport system ATP-binding protein
MYDTPASRFAASFIGHSNLLPGTVAGDRLQWNGGALPLPPNAASAAGDATLMVRPENARLVAQGQGAIRGTVREVVFQGSDLKVIVEIGHEQTFAVRTSCQGTRPVVGDPVGISWDPAHSVLLTR